MATCVHDGNACAATRNGLVPRRRLPPPTCLPQSSHTLRLHAPSGAGPTKRPTQRSLAKAKKGWAGWQPSAADPGWRRPAILPGKFQQDVCVCCDVDWVRLWPDCLVPGKTTSPGRGWYEQTTCTRMYALAPPPHCQSTEPLVHSGKPGTGSCERHHGWIRHVGARVHD